MICFSDTKLKEQNIPLNSTFTLNFIVQIGLAVLQKWGGRDRRNRKGSGEGMLLCKYDLHYTVFDHLWLSLYSI